MNWQAILRLIPQYRRLEAELEALRDGEKTAQVLYRSERERCERLEAENLHHMKLVTDWTCMMNGWAPIYGIAPVPVIKHGIVANADDDRPRRRQARDVVSELDRDFEREFRSMQARAVDDNQ